MNNDGEKGQTNKAAQERLQRATRGGLNAVTGGAWDKVRNAPIIGGAARKAENKLANKLDNKIDEPKLGQKATNPISSQDGNNRHSDYKDVDQNNRGGSSLHQDHPKQADNRPSAQKPGGVQQNHQRPNLGVKPSENQSQSPSSGPKSVGKQSLVSSLTNKAKNAFPIGKQKNKQTSDSNDEKSEENTGETAEDSDSSEKSKDKGKVIARRIRLLKVSIAFVAAFAFYAMIMTVASALSGGAVFRTAPFSSYKEYGTENFHSVTAENDEIHEDEINFYKKMKQVKEENDEDIDVNYVVAILMQLFNEYSPSYDNFSEEEAERLNASGGIDYAKMTDNVDGFVEVIKNAESSDYSVDGVIYNAIKSSDEFKKYYEEVLTGDNTDEILENIFRLAEEFNEDERQDETAITEETSVTVTSPSTTSSSIASSTSTLSMKDYLAGSIYADTDKISSGERIKAYTVTYTTNIMAENKKLTIDVNNASASNSICSIKNGCSYDKDGNLVSGGGSQNSKNTNYYNGKYYYKVPLTSTEQETITKAIDSVYGKVLVNSDGTYPTLDITKLGGLGDGDYESGLKKAYGNLSIKNVGENNYITEGIFNGVGKIVTAATFYEQRDYKQSFCGLSRATIAGSGCGVTSMAIIASTYENNKKYDPIYMNAEAKKMGLCGYDGTAQAFFCKEASKLGYKCSRGAKTNGEYLKKVLKHLSNGGLVVAHMSAGHFTSGGHYMVLGGVDSKTEKVYVYDPNNRSNSSYRKTGNGWYDFNSIIVKEAWYFYIIEKRG